MHKLHNQSVSINYRVQHLLHNTFDNAILKSGSLHRHSFIVSLYNKHVEFI